MSIEFTDEEIVEAAMEGRLRRGQWGSAVLERGGAYTSSPGIRVAPARVAALREAGRLYLAGSLFTTVAL